MYIYIYMFIRNVYFIRKSYYICNFVISYTTFGGFDCLVFRIQMLDKNTLETPNYFFMVQHLSVSSLHQGSRPFCVTSSSGALHGSAALAEAI